MELSNKILSDITVYMKYAKYLPELNRRETWEELVTRNKNMHIKKYPKLVNDIEAAYKFVYEKKVLPSYAIVTGKQVLAMFLFDLTLVST